jgi:hypothetical protein
MRFCTSRRSADRWSTAIFGLAHSNWPLFALRTAVLLIGGDKTGGNLWYEKFVPVADRIYDRHLDELRKERKI